MNIDTMQDSIDNIELLKQREITYYEGNWCCFKVDSNGCGSVEQFWKDLGKVYPFTDEELSESIANKKAIIDEQYKEANSLSCAGV